MKLARTDQPLPGFGPLASQRCLLASASRPFRYIQWLPCAFSTRLALRPGKGGPIVVLGSGLATATVRLLVRGVNPVLWDSKWISAASVLKWRENGVNPGLTPCNGQTPSVFRVEDPSNASLYGD
ncbi:hypothetical protein F9C07_5622 [Aspergillus flavus]|uniref:Uncharacterized protein n=1 Tax=Aspergillus flavus (strain ATCC 200026 / FGSC A1120 / IAM 13836 / NRRL 3357 / JCM 12722 / SRRC 167) TaxID=332952 RepID=A0A7U2MXC9_ASPFN|nr:hypothetical protein F9C07_5622 [Aspergillus flavus]